MTIQIYADIECKKPIDTIEWDKILIIKLVTGKTIRLSNTAKAGQIAIATVYLRNENTNRYCITSLKHPDNRLKISVENGWLYSKIPIKLTINILCLKK